MFLQTIILFAQDSTEPTSTVEAEVETAVVEEEEKKAPLVFGGSIDAYFRANLSGDFDSAPGTSFANLPGFSLGMANLTISKDGAKAGFMADFVFGPRGEDATFLSGALRPVMDGLSNNSSIVNQLYAYWNITDKVTATIGNFNTFLGYEVISPVSNFNYSTSYMFSYGPFSHTGLKLDADLGSGFSLMAGVFNPTDATEYNPDNAYVGGLQLGYDFGNGSIYLNGIFQGGDDELARDDFFQFDVTAGVDVTEKIYIGLNATTASDSFTGAALYLQGQVADPLKLGVRAEYFVDKGLGLVDIDENIFDLTISANYSVGDLTIIPEFRIDMASQSIFPDGTDTSDSLSSFVLAAVYGF